MQILQQPASLTFENNIADFKIQKATGETSLLFRLFLGSTLILEEEYMYDADGFVYIRDLASLVSFYFTEEVTPDSGYQIVTGSVKEFAYTINENEDNGDFVVIRSSAEVNGLTATQFVRSRFLTRLQAKRTLPTSNEFLSFLMTDTDTTFVINYRVFCSAQGVMRDLTGVLLTINETTQAYRVAMFDASYKAVKAVAEDGQPFTIDHIYEYRIWAESTASGVLFNSFSFFPDYSRYSRQKLFVFKNSFHMPEVFISTGKCTTNSRLEAGFSISGLRMRKVTQEIELLHSCNTGYLSDEELAWLDDFITAYSVSKLEGSALVDVVITETDKSSSTSNELQAFTFTYRLAKINHQSVTGTLDGLFDHTFDTTYE